MLRLARMAMAVGAIGVISACSAVTASPSGQSPSAVPRPTATADCSAVDLRAPSGARVDLTGTWDGPEALLFVRQFGDCVWWEELSAFVDDQPAGYHYRRLFSGQIMNDFTVVGRFGDVYTSTDVRYFHAPPRVGQAVYRISFDQQGTTELITLEGLYFAPVSMGEVTTVWRRTSDETQLP